MNNHKVSTNFIFQKIYDRKSKRNIYAVLFGITCLKNEMTNTKSIILI